VISTDEVSPQTARLRSGGCGLFATIAVASSTE